MKEMGRVASIGEMSEAQPGRCTTSRGRLLLPAAEQYLYKMMAGVVYGVVCYALLLFFLGGNRTLKVATSSTRTRMTNTRQSLPWIPGGQSHLDGQGLLRDQSNLGYGVR